MDITKKLGLPRGKLVFIPASYKAEEIVKVLAQGYEIGALREALGVAIQKYALDYLIIDTHPGIEKSTLLSIGVCEAVLLVTRLDSQDLFGTSVMREIARTLKKPEVLVANMVPPGIDGEKLQDRLKSIFPSAPSAVVPFYNDVLKSLSSEVFVLGHPEHEFASKLAPIIEQMESFQVQPAV
jgi:MinD-like ATPase involved in chromosome partitioning or flagellar assembly